MGSKYLHTMIRVHDLDRTIEFFKKNLDMQETRRHENEKGRFTLVFLAAADDVDSASQSSSPTLELTYNWGSSEEYTGGRSFGHLAYEVDDIYVCCKRMQDNGVVINRPPRDGNMAFVLTPDGISIELLQKGAALEPAEPWASMENSGSW